MSKFLTAVCVLLASSIALHAEQGKPNIVIVMADDLGYGDVQPLNSRSEISTPAFNRLAKEGLTFTDAHSSSGVCTPTRYGLVCGRYAWRTSLKRGVLGGYSKPLIEPERQTIASVLKSCGYSTACVGKWHLGLGWVWNESPDNINNFGIAGKPGSVDYEQALTDSPVHHGFDQSYIIPASLDMSPYVYIKNDRVTKIPGDSIKGAAFPKFYRTGEIAEDFQIQNVLGHLTEQAVEIIETESKKDQPYFLYFPLSAPHKPVYPTEEFLGQSKKGPYGDFIMQVDATIGKIIDAIEASGESENTLLIVTSDNGSFMNRIRDNSKPDHLTAEKVQGFHESSHLANGQLRGTKADVWEGGHRVPFFVRWKNHAASEKRISNTICHVDLLATCAEVAGAEFDRSASEDSFSFTKLIENDVANYTRPPVILHSSGGTFAIRDGKWKLVMGSGSGGRAQPRGKAFERPYFLFDMQNDISETTNLIDQHQELEQELIRKFEKIAHDDHLESKPK